MDEQALLSLIERSRRGDPEAQDALVAEGVRKNAAKQAMLNLRRLFENGEDA